MKKAILIHVQRFTWDKRGCMTKTGDKRIYDITELRGLTNYDYLPSAGTLNEVLIDDELNCWFACSGYDGRTGLYLKEWDGKKKHVKNLL